MFIARSQYQPLTKAIFSSPEVCGNILNVFWGGVKTTKISILQKLRYMKLHCLVGDSGL